MTCLEEQLGRAYGLPRADLSIALACPGVRGGE